MINLEICSGRNREPVSLVILEELSDKITAYARHEKMAEIVFYRALLESAVESYEATGVI
ncbi:MAG TPA: hypothetical protein O0X42_00635 [Methanocorpusculum sp.]|nr:hypothetical protein [Methanocorpusculum sp.]